METSIQPTQLTQLTRPNRHNTIPMFRRRLVFIVIANGGKLQLVRPTLEAAEKSVELLIKAGYADVHVHIGAGR